MNCYMPKDYSDHLLLYFNWNWNYWNLFYHPVRLCLRLLWWWITGVPFLGWFCCNCKNLVRWPNVSWWLWCWDNRILRVNFKTFLKIGTIKTPIQVFAKMSLVSLLPDNLITLRTRCFTIVEKILIAWKETYSKQ